MSTGIEQTVKDYILREFLPGEDPSQLADDTPLFTSGIIDSIRMLKLVSFLEESFGVIIEAHELGADYLDTPALIASLVRSRT
jgi:acyl carrier protein